jgi:hypothetical protein
MSAASIRRRLDGAMAYERVSLDRLEYWHLAESCRRCDERVMLGEVFARKNESDELTFRGKHVFELGVVG